MSFDLKSARWWAQELISEAVQEGDTVLDCTMGNGYDTLFLCNKVGESGHVYAFDVQQDALDNTAKRLEDAGVRDRATLLLSGHEHVKEHVHESVTAAMFNLGWLPGTDKERRTRAETTLIAVNACLELLKEEGLLTVCIYPGHDEGKVELQMLTEWGKNLPSDEYDAMVRSYLNQSGDPPILLAVKKNKRRKKK